MLRLVTWHIDQATFAFESERELKAWLRKRRVAFDFDPARSDDGGDSVLLKPRAAARQFSLSENNSHVVVLEEGRNVAISVWVKIKLDLKPGINVDSFALWSSDKNGWDAARITPAGATAVLISGNGGEFIYGED